MLRRRRAIVLLAAATTLSVGVVGTSQAVAAPRHGGPGEIAIVAAEPSTDGGSVHLEIAITYVNDGEAAERATVSVTGTSGAGATAGPVDVVATDVVGTYVADVPVPEPGAWTFAVVSTFPPATAEVPVAVEGAATTDTGAPVDTADAGAGTTAATGGATTTAPGATTAAPADGAAADEVAAGATDDGDDDGGLPALAWVGIAIAVVAGAGGVLYAVRRGG
jgi:hypothetical protein